MPRWGDDDTDAAYGIGVPIQFGPGLPTIWPSPALAEYENGWHDRRANLSRTMDVADWLRAVHDEDDAYRKAASTIIRMGTDWNHLQYLHDEFCRHAVAIRKCSGWAYSSIWSGPAPWVQELVQHPREEALGVLEQMYQQGMSPPVSPTIPKAAPETKREHGQGMTRGYWRGGSTGRFRGYSPVGKISTLTS